MTFWGQVWGLLARDLTAEGRAGEVIRVIIPFGAVAAMVVPLATTGRASTLEVLGGPVFWLIALLFALHIALRRSGDETQSQRDLLTLLGVDPAARFVGRSLSTTAMMLGLLVVVAPLVALFYNPPIPPFGPFILVLALFSPGMAMLSTLAGDVTTGLRVRASLAPLLVAPLAIPLLVGAAQATNALIESRTTIPWVSLLVAADLALAVTGVLTARAMEELR